MNKPVNQKENASSSPSAKQTPGSTSSSSQNTSFEKTTSVKKLSPKIEPVKWVDQVEDNVESYEDL